jgi:sulfite oxidase
MLRLKVRIMNSFRHPLSVSRRSFLSAVAAGGSALLLPGTRRLFSADDKAEQQLIVHTEVPRNAEPALEDLVRTWITPVRYFYVRSHAPVPKIDPGSYRLIIEGLVERPLSLSLAELGERFPRANVTATMCCAGNRRSEHSANRPVEGVQWGAGPLGSAEWSGFNLSEVLRAAGLKESAGHVCFDGLDEHEKHGETITFGGSIPLSRVMSEQYADAPVLIADRMNGEVLAPDHGFPLRTVVPGFIGARSVKWLGRIVVSDRPSDNHYVKDAYRLVTEDTPEMWEQADPIYHLPLQSAIAVPAAEADLNAGPVAVRGYAVPPGGGDGTLRRVELSSDGGQTWTAARLTDDESPYCWRLWDAEVDLAAGAQTLVVRAVDSSGNRQPQEVPWNLKGYMYNAWHRVTVRAG